MALYFHRATSRGPAADPLERVSRLGASSPVVFAVTFALSFLLYGSAAARSVLGGLSGFSREMAAIAHASLPQEIDVEEEKAPEPPKAAEPEAKPVAAPIPAPPPPAATREAAAPKNDEPPPPAEAGKIVAAEPDPDEPVDLRGAFVTGNGTSFAGGVTSSIGTAKNAVRSLVTSPKGRPGGSGKGTGSTNGSGDADLSRAAGRLGSSDWKCDWPPGVPDDIDEARVTIEVSVAADGRPTMVSVLDRPGHGFERAAQACAMGQTFQAALDAAGRPIPGKTKPFRVHFDR